jgi:uncharacterized SAM-binding protein YcdF (DUF218 family)
VITALLLPSGLLTLALTGGVIALWLGRVRLARRLLAVALAIALTALSPLPDALTVPLEDRFPRAAADGPPIAGLVVLGGSEDAAVAHARGVTAVNEAGERLIEAAALARAHPTARLVLAGGRRSPRSDQPSEAATMATLLATLGVTRDRMTLEETSRTTAENAREVARLMGPPPAGRWLLVTSAAHMPRAIAAFRRAGLALEPWPVDYRTRGAADSGWRPADSLGNGLRRLDLLAREYGGLLVYRVVGHSDALWPAP